MNNNNHFCDSLEFSRSSAPFIEETVNHNQSKENGLREICTLNLGSRFDIYSRYIFMVRLKETSQRFP